jgi:hypothetical protein
MYNCLLLLLIFIALFIMMSRCETLASKYQSGDILLMFDNKNKVKDMYLIYRGNVLTVGNKGDLKQRNVSDIVRSSPYTVYLYKLYRPLTPLQRQTFDILVRRNYAGIHKTHCVFQETDKNKQHFYDCSGYIPMIMSMLGILNLGLNYNCPDNSDPKCFQAFYNTSVFINSKLYQLQPSKLSNTT